MHMLQQLMLLYKGNAGSKGHKQGSVPEHKRMLQLDDPYKSLKQLD